MNADDSIHAADGVNHLRGMLSRQGADYDQTMILNVTSVSQAQSSFLVSQDLE